MPTIKLTQASVSKIRAPSPTGKQTLYWDADLRGFGLLVSGKTNAKTFVAQRALPNGKDRRVTIGSVHELSLKEAREAARKSLYEMRQGKDPKEVKRTDFTLSQALDTYLAAHSNLKPRSADHYREVIGRHLQAWLGTPLRHITPDMAEAKLKEIQTTVAAAGRGHHGGATANGALKAFSVIWNYFLERDLTLPANPTRRLKRRWYRVLRRERVVRTEDMPKFYAAVLALPNPVHRDYVMLLLYTGLRRNEAASLKWADVDMQEKIINVPGASTKSSRPLKLPLPEPVYKLLLERSGREEFLFPGASRSRHLTSAKYIFRLIYESCGVKVSPHDLRRVFLSVGQNRGVPLLTLKALANHATSNDVTSGYIQIDFPELRRASDRITAEITRLAVPQTQKIIPLSRV